MPLLNYTTSIDAEKTISEIEKMLAQSGAEKIMKDYDREGNVVAISFLIETMKGKLPVRLPANINAVMQVINQQTGEYKKTKYGQQRVIPIKYYNDKVQASRVTWRIIKDWVEAQLALYFLQMVKMEEIFLPYVYSDKFGKTMYELLEEKNFNILQLEEGKNDRK